MRRGRWLGRPGRRCGLTGGAGPGRLARLATRAAAGEPARPTTRSRSTASCPDHYPVADRGDARGLLKAGQRVHLARLDEREHRPGGAGTSRTPGAMQVVLRVVRRVEVHDQVDVVDVDPTRSDVGGHQHARVTGREAGERALTLVLVQVAVDRRRRGTGVAELTSEPVSPVLGAHEEQAARRAARDLRRDRKLLRRRARRTPGGRQFDGRIGDATAWIAGSSGSGSRACRPRGRASPRTACAARRARSRRGSG